MKPEIRIAMWSGPRNISTALMRSWDARPDTVVCDEPLYAHYLRHTGITHHPGHAEIVEHHEPDLQTVIDWLLAPLPPGKTVFYQKQMAHHLLPHVPLDWTRSLANVFLIRDPREMLLSLLEFFPKPRLEETGLPQQSQLFQRLQAESGLPPAVIDARDVLLDPAGMLRALCEAVHVPYDDCMLQWQPGIRETDGIWAKHWYANVARSTSFGSYTPKPGEVPPQHRDLLSQCEDLYEQLAEHKLKPATTSN